MDPLEVLARGKVEARKREMEAGNKSDGRDLLTLQCTSVSYGQSRRLNSRCTGQYREGYAAGHAAA